MYFKDYITYINESYKTASKYAHDERLTYTYSGAVKHAGLNYIDFKQFVNDDVWNSHRGHVRMQNMKDI